MMFCSNIWRLRLLLLSLLLPLSLSSCINSSQEPDPVILDFPIAYVKRTLPVDNNGNLLSLNTRSLIDFNPGGDLYLRDRASPSAAEINITYSKTNGQGDVRDVEASYDGTKILFSMHLPELPNTAPEDQPTWNIWEYDIPSKSLSRVISGDITAESGQDLAPHYLPDGRIVFSSTRQTQSGEILLNEGKSQYPGQSEDLQEQAAVLHVMNSDGSSPHQISFNQSHDLDPTVLSNGRILFSRWDNMGNRNDINLYTVNPDGTDLELSYGSHSHDTGSNSSMVDFIQPRLMQDGRIMATLIPQGSNNGGGNVVMIDIENYIDNDQPTLINTGMSGSAQQIATINDIQTTNAPSLGGRFLSSHPLWDGTNRMLVSWSPCRLIEEGRIVPCTSQKLAQQTVVTAPPLFGLYIYDRANQTQLPVVLGEEGRLIQDVVVLKERPLPTIIQDEVKGGAVLDETLYDEGTGLINIRSVYDIDGVDSTASGIDVMADPAQTDASQRSARYIRITKAVAIPDDTTRAIPNTAFGISRQQLMREIIGYGMVEPDGSVKIKVPANTPLTLSILDGNGRRIGGRHQNWLQVRPGETLNCIGCHDHSSGTPHGRGDGPASIYNGSTMPGQPFPNTHATLWTNGGESMAETRTRISCLTDCSARNLITDLRYEDVWTDPLVRAPDATTTVAYADLDPALTHPVSGSCQTTWQPLCRIVINYETHIHPIWSLPRVDGSMADVTCTNCHNNRDAVLQAQVPAAQLDLSDGPSSDQPEHFKAYRELLVADVAQELVNGALIDSQVQATDGSGNLLYEMDEFGNLILDGMGNPIPIMVDVPAPGPSMSINGANTRYFLSKFDVGGSHEAWLSPAEMKLIAEWLDIGAQYYNNPFDVPQN